jgi:hypothetical protein
MEKQLKDKSRRIGKLIYKFKKVEEISKSDAVENKGTN